MTRLRWIRFVASTTGLGSPRPHRRCHDISWVDEVKATAWNNGQHRASGAGYGVRLSVADRDRYVKREWKSIRLEVPGQGSTTVPLSESFWTRCSELRFATVGRWLQATGFAPWPKGKPPALTVEPLGGDTFRVEADGDAAENPHIGGAHVHGGG
jgi:hypothetical protein